MSFPFVKISIVFAFLMNEGLLAQVINQEYLKNTVERIKLLSNKQLKQDSLEDLSSKINRLDGANTMPLYKTLDSLFTEEYLKLTFYNEWATTASRRGNPKFSKKLRRDGLRMAQNTKQIKYELEFLNSIASLYVSLSKADSVAYYTILADKLIKKYPEKLNYGQWQIHYRYAMMHSLLGDTKEQKIELEKSWINLNKLENQNNRGFLIYTLLDFYRQTDDDINQARFTELFIQHYNKKKLTTPDYHFPITSILLKDDSQESLDNLIRINRLSDSLNNLNSLSQTTTTLATRLIEIDRAKEAIPYLKNTIEKLNAANYPVNSSGDLLLLHQAYQSIGDYKSAYTILAQQKEMEDSLRSSKMLSTIADFEVKYETEKKEAELLKLNFEAEKSKQKQLIYTIALISGGLILTILAFYFHRNKQKNILLAKQKKMLEITVDEKNVLLKETHHRVKNSFQIVSSLLYLQSENIKDKEAQAAMKEAQNRVRSMVLIHQRLYSKDQLVGVSTDEYFKDLVHDVFESHQAETEKISYTIEAIPIILGIESTTSLGLILNELITNVIKHAFPATHAKGSMHISFQQENETLVLKVIDTGLGMPEKIKETSFGIELITALATKLKAKLEFTPNLPKGTIATLTIHRFSPL